MQYELYLWEQHPFFLATKSDLPKTDDKRTGLLLWGWRWGSHFFSNGPFSSFFFSTLFKLFKPGSQHLLLSPCLE